mmetsp:Transcript_20251/g.49682  ORF Transcript_20251/g.49682 Transcript_20251/m.49682 type:complete len:94 (+) Transcript_20251:168-449(+)
MTTRLPLYMYHRRSLIVEQSSSNTNIPRAQRNIWSIEHSQSKRSSIFRSKSHRALSFFNIMYNLLKMASSPGPTGFEKVFKFVFMHNLSALSC